MGKNEDIVEARLLKIEIIKEKKMTKIERTMAMLREQERNRRPSPKMPPPKWDMRYKLAIAAMRSDRQVKCQNCKRRYRPCEFYRDCKTEDGNRIYFHPKEDLLRQHLRRVDAILNEAQTLIRKNQPNDTN